MKAKQLKELYLKFFESKEHKVIPTASLVPENDPTVLFTTAGMHPLVPFLVGQPHPSGKRLTNFQKCIRTGDIDEVGDATHHTFFEMLGNWSLGDYFKDKAIEYSFEFLTSKDWLNLPIDRLAITCFCGDEDALKDIESFNKWLQLGIPEQRIAYLPKKDNWWGPAGKTGPCGPDTEMFYWVDNESKAPEVFDPEDKRWVEIWNDVFMQYNKTNDGKYEPLKQKNVDTGLGVERVTALLQGLDDNYLTERFKPVIDLIENLSNKKYQEKKKEMRIVADHLRATIFILGDSRAVIPSNVDQGYILRRFIRRSIMILYKLEISEEKICEITNKFIEMYKEEYIELDEKKEYILDQIKLETKKFQKTLEKGLKELEKIIFNQAKGNFYKENKRAPTNEELIKYNESLNEIEIKGKQLFDLFQSHGFPYEMVIEEIKDTYKKTIKNQENLISEFKEEFKKHQELSRKGAEQKFKGGLSEASEITKKYHTATHILGEVLRKVLNDDTIVQKGSNITPERLRFDFNFDRKLTDEEKKQIEDEINEIISKGYVIEKQEMDLKKALDSGAQAEFGTKYPEKVWVYTIGDFSKEICMGPHCDNTKELGVFKIIKEESSAAGIRRIKAKLL